MKHCRWLLGILSIIFFLPLSSQALTVQDLSLETGEQVWLAPHQGAVVSLYIVFKGAGGITDPLNKEGRADLFSRLCSEGAGSLDAQDLAERLDALNSSIYLASDRDHMTCHITALRSNLDATLQVAHDMLFKPHLDDQVLSKVKHDAIAQLASLEGDPYYVLQKAKARILFGTHPYNRFPSEGSLKRVNLKDVKEYTRFWGKDRVCVTVAGHLSAEETARALHQLLKGLPPQAEKVTLKDVVLPKKGHIYHIPMTLPQSVVCFTQPGLKAQHPDFHAAVVLNGILGGGAILTSRLAKEVRVKSGYAYSVSSALREDEYHVAWEGSLASKAETTSKALQLVQKEWKRAAQGTVTEQEVEDVKAYLTGSWALHFSNSQDMTRALMRVMLQGYSVRYIEERNLLLQNITLQDVQRVARELLKPESLSFVVLGSSPINELDVIQVNP